MSSIYEHLAKAHLKSEKMKPGEAELPPQPSLTKYPRPPKFRFIKTMVTLSLLVSIGACGAGYYLYTFLTAQQQRVDALEKYFQQTSGALHELQAQGSQQADEFAKLRYDVTTAGNKSLELRSELERQKIESANVSKKLLELEDRDRVLEQKIGELKASSAPAAAPEAVAAPETGEASLPAASDANSSFLSQGLEDWVNEISQPAAQPAAQAPVSEPAEPAKAPSGPKVMTVNENFNFIVINIGSKNDVKMGERFYVQQGGKTIATVEVEKLYDNFAAATITDKKKKAQIHEGDAIVHA